MRHAAGIQSFESSVVRWGWRPWHYALLLLIHAHFFTSHGLAEARDMVDVFYPWADAVRLSIVKFHQFPWWNPWAMAGQPLFADPASVAVLMPDTLLVLIFGAVTGLKIAIVLYVLVGYEGSRLLCRHLFGASRFVEAVSVIPAIIPTLALHFNEGHIIFVMFYLVPWLLYLALTWQVSAARATAFGVVIACFLLSYIHYTVIMAFSLLGPLVVYQLARRANSKEIWLKAGLVVCTALGLSLVRLGCCLTIVAQFPRTETSHYPLVASLSEVFRTLVEPLQNRHTPANIADLGWWELGSYVGLPALLLAYEGARRGGRRLWPIYAAALLCLVLAWNNRDRAFPSYWLHFIPPWKSMLVISRWSMFASLFLLIGTVHGLVQLRQAGHPTLSSALALLVVLDLGYASNYAYRETFTVTPPPFGEMAGPPETVADSHTESWAHERMNLVSMGAVCSLVGYGLHPPARQHLGTPNYGGDFVGTKPVVVESWSPNHFVLRASPGDTVTLNMNPSNYWVMNGRRLFPHDRAFEIDKPFQVKAPAGGRMEFEASDPIFVKLAVMQALFLLGAVALFRALGRGQPRRARIAAP
jgi:hypothetical protein